MDKTKSTMFLEWISIVAPVIACSLFLYGEIKDQRQRTDKLYETIIDLIKSM
jgi:hypothetical protein